MRVGSKLDLLTRKLNHLIRCTDILLTAITDAEHARPARWTYTLGCRFAIFHGDSLSTFHFFFRTAFYTICFHLVSSLKIIIIYTKRLMIRLFYNNINSILTHVNRVVQTQLSDSIIYCRFQYATRLSFILVSTRMLESAT